MNTKQTLIRIALKSFLEKGYDAVPLKYIANAAGIRQASIYYHFKDKHELFEACAHAFFQQWNTWMSESLPLGSDLKVLLMGIIESLGLDSECITTLYGAQTKTGQYRFLLDVLAHCPEQLGEMHKFNTAFYSLLQEKMDEAKHSGVIAASVSCRSVYCLLSALMEGSNILHFTDPDIDFAKEKQQLFKLIWEGMCNVC